VDGGSGGRHDRIVQAEGMTLKGCGPFAGSVDHCQNVNRIPAESIWNDKRRSGNHKFASASDPSSSACFGMAPQHSDRSLDPFNHA